MAVTSEKHGVQLDLASFAASVTVPSSPFPAQSVPDLQLSAAGKAVDVGAVLENINDGFAGDAPDLGAYELGTAPPVYGPRP